VATQLVKKNKSVLFDGDCQPTRVPLFKPRRKTWPFPHPWNYHQPIERFEAYFYGTDEEVVSGRHNRYLEVPGFAPILVTRDPGIIRVITSETGDLAGQFDRDMMLSIGVASFVTSTDGSKRQPSPENVRLMGRLLGPNGRRLSDRARRQVFETSGMCQQRGVFRDT
jgi:hypothetical protein